MKTINTIQSINFENIEFDYYRDKKTQSSKLQLLDKNEMIIAVLDKWDFKEMEVMKLNISNEEHICQYCNKYKATNIIF